MRSSVLVVAAVLAFQPLLALAQGTCVCVQVKMYQVDPDTYAYWAYQYDWSAGDNDCSDDNVQAYTYYDQDYTTPRTYCPMGAGRCSNCISFGQDKTHFPDTNFTPKPADTPLDIGDAAKFDSLSKNVSIEINGRIRFFKLFWCEGKDAYSGVNFGYGFEITSDPGNAVSIAPGNWKNAFVRFRVVVDVNDDGAIGTGDINELAIRLSPVHLNVMHDSKAYIVRVAQ